MSSLYSREIWPDYEFMPIYLVLHICQAGKANGMELVKVLLLSAHRDKFFALIFLLLRSSFDFNSFSLKIRLETRETQRDLFVSSKSATFFCFFWCQNYLCLRRFRFKNKCDKL